MIRAGRRLASWWWSSLTLRIIAMTAVGSAIVLVLAGGLLMRQISDGVLQGKRAAAISEASSRLARMQQQLRDTDLQTSSVYEKFGQIADEVSATPNQYYLVVQGPVSGYAAPGVLSSSVPASLSRSVVEDGTKIFVTETLVQFSDPHRASVPGLAVGGQVTGPSGNVSYRVYFLFPADREQQTLDLVQQAVLLTGALLFVLLLGISVLTARQITAPVRQASRTATSLSQGNLDVRMHVRGSDELARLSRSMNHMAETLQSQIQQLKALSTVQQRFVSDVSHELRTPLTTVRMAAELLYDSRDELSAPHARSVELLYDEVGRFEALLADLLEISRFDAGAALLTTDEVDVVALVERELAAQRPFAEKSGTELRFHPLVSEVTAEVDGRRITRILRNLITNAIEHSESNPIDVTIAADDDAVAITVRDHGVGFLASQAEDVFRRFWRADPSRQRVVGGTGLGLAISLEDAQLHGGWLSAWGRPGRGAQFRLTLPRRVSTMLKSSPLPLEPRDPSAQLHQPPTSAFGVISPMVER